MDWKFLPSNNYFINHSNCMQQISSKRRKFAPVQCSNGERKYIHHPRKKNPPPFDTLCFHFPISRPTHRLVLLQSIPYPLSPLVERVDGGVEIPVCRNVSEQSVSQSSVGRLRLSSHQSHLVSIEWREKKSHLHHLVSEHLEFFHRPSPVQPTPFIAWFVMRSSLEAHINCIAHLPASSHSAGTMLRRSLFGFNKVIDTPHIDRFATVSASDGENRNGTPRLHVERFRPPFRWPVTSIPAPDTSRRPR